MKPTPKKPAKLNAGQYAKMVKKCQNAAAMVAKLTAKLEEKAEEIETLKSLSETQDRERRAEERQHSDEMLAVMAEIQVIKAMVKGTP